jgi:hypothetical protein
MSEPTAEERQAQEIGRQIEERRELAWNAFLDAMPWKLRKTFEDLHRNIFRDGFTHGVECGKFIAMRMVTARMDQLALMAGQRQQGDGEQLAREGK